MGCLYLLRHGETNTDGALTDSARQAARNLGKKLPKFTKVISSDAQRARQTAALLANIDPRIDARAGFYVPAEERKREIHEYGILHDTDFFEAAETYQDGELAKGIHEKALDLNRLIDETRSQLAEDEVALIVSHDLTITNAMALKGLPKVSSNYLSGYKIEGEDSITKLIA